MEAEKFLYDADGNIAVRVIIPGTVEGSFTPRGLKDFVVRTISIDDTATQIPTTDLTETDAVSIHNKGTSILYIGPTDTVTADSVVGTTSGWEVPPGGYVGFDLRETAEIWAICETGKSVIVKIMEAGNA